MKKAIILARVSTPEQEKTGLSLEDIQLPQMRDYALEKGFVVDSEYVFQETASQKLRKKFDEMVDYIKKSPDIQAIIAFRVLLPKNITNSLKTGLSKKRNMKPNWQELARQIKSTILPHLTYWNWHLEVINYF